MKADTNNPMPLRKLSLFAVFVLMAGVVAYLTVFQRVQPTNETVSSSPAAKRHPLAESLVQKAAHAPLQLAASDWIEVQPVSLQSTIQVSGSVRAVHAALVKARVPGDLMVLHVREGMSVRRGDILGQIDPRDYQTRLREREAQLRAAQAQLESAERNFESNKALVSRGFLSQNTGDNARSAKDAAQATRDAASFQLEQARKALEDTWLIATIDGTIQERFALPGEKLPSDARVLSLVDTKEMEAEIMVPLQQLSQVRIGQSMSLQVEGLDKQIDGQVQRINPGTSGNTRQVAVFVRLPRHHLLKVGSFVQGSLPASTRENVLALPFAAIRTGGQSSTEPSSHYVWTVKDQKLVRQPVTVGLRDVGTVAPNGARGMVEVITGLQAGQIVIVSNLGAQEGRIAEGQEVALGLKDGTAAAAQIKAGAANKR